jgi:adenosylcobinamide-phosphate synthase
MSTWILAVLGITLSALIIEDLFGYPAALFRRIGHPVTWIGALISRLDGAMNREQDGFARRKAGGILAIIIVAGAAAGAGLAVQALLFALLPFPAAILACGLLASTLLAQKSLRDHVKAVETGLDMGIEAGREAVSHIVGRDTRRLDEAGVARAAIESLAENTSDGIVAPAFWCLLLGLPGIALYKAVNTADSMIGHRSDRHLAFGWAAARLDDLLNLPWSRLNALLIVAGALVTPHASPARAFTSAWRDAGRHQSPNAGWPEAALAGALGFKLGGPRDYDGEKLDLAVMGEGRSMLSPGDIAAALRLQRTTMLIMTGMIALAFALAVQSISSVA